MISTTEHTGDCSVGHYCPLESTSAEQNVCNQGTYCELASSVPTDCIIGTYGDSDKTDKCQACPSGQFCTQPGLATTGVACPDGSYCPSPFLFHNFNPIEIPGLSESLPAAASEVGTFIETGILCLPGYYSDDSASANDHNRCLLCPKGKFCFHFGTTKDEVDNNDDLKCEAGYICGEGNRNGS